MFIGFRPALKIAVIGSCSISLMHCGTVADNVKVKDSNTPGYSFSLAHKIDPDSRWAITADFQRTNGEGPQTFPEVIQYSGGNQDVTRPEITTQNDFTIAATSIAARWTLLDKPHLKMNLYFGGTQVNADVDIRDGNGGKWHLARDSFSFTPKFELIYPINDKLSLSASTTDLLKAHTNYNTQSIQLDFHVNDTLTFNLGYKHWHFDDDPDASSELAYPNNQLAFDRTSELELNSKGVTGGIAISF